ncbi:hypothetical protein RB195_000522 [Necator americanus]|uniref:Uncharacterized protein n=1 Tax=Necator americanus TaxID=51031 RepID=A0ABR1DD60_NECAM
MRKCINIASELKHNKEIMADKKEGKSKEEEDFCPPTAVASEYLVSQIRLDKPTEKEVKEELQKQDSPQDDEPLRELTPCPSEYQLTKLNYYLAGVPMVQAFNEAEKKKK